MKRQCTATSKRSGERCRRSPVEGSTVCATHGGSARQVKEAGKQREALAVAQRMVQRAGVDVDPIEHLLDSLHLASQLVRVWGTMVAAIDEAAERRPAGVGAEGRPPSLSRTRSRRRDHGTCGCWRAAAAPGRRRRAPGTSRSTCARTPGRAAGSSPRRSVTRSRRASKARPASCRSTRRSGGCRQRRAARRSSGRTAARRSCSAPTPRRTSTVSAPAATATSTGGRRWPPTAARGCVGPGAAWSPARRSPALDRFDDAAVDEGVPGPARDASRHDRRQDARHDRRQPAPPRSGRRSRRPGTRGPGSAARS
jgi:hypothetical protein